MAYVVFMIVVFIEVVWVWRIGLIGFGNVGQGFIRLLASKADFLENKFGFRFSVVAISDPVKGNAYDPGGLDLSEIVSHLDKYGDIKKMEVEKDFNSMDVVRNFDLDIVVEATPTNIESGEPGLSHIRGALDAGRHVVTSNKGPIALAYRELSDLARRRGVFLRFEGTVMSGTPVISMGMELLSLCELKGVYGILNGTTNYILTRMEEGLTYDDALREAQTLGYAEADPTMDVDAWDPAIKIVILANVLMDADLRIEDVERTGIRGISRDDVMAAVGRGKRIKLIAYSYMEDGRVYAGVGPKELDASEPIASVMGVTNAITFKTDVLGDITVVGPGAGRIETGYALLNDILYIHRHT